MTEECLTQNQLDRLAARKLRGRELNDALAHLETCEHCRQCVELPPAAEILARFGAEPVEEPMPEAGEGETSADESSSAAAEISERTEEIKSEDDFDDFLQRIRARRRKS